MRDKKDFKFPLKGFRARLLSSEWMVEIRFSNDRHEEFVLQIESPFTLILSDGRSVDLDPGQMTTDSRLFVDLIASGVASLVAHEDGSVDVVFADESSVHAPSSSEFEPWNLTGPGGLKIVSLPGGGLSTWGADTK